MIYAGIKPVHKMLQWSQKLTEAMKKSPLG